MLEGLLVDLVPYGDRYLEQEHTWHNSEAWFWAEAGNRPLPTKAALRRGHEEWLEWREKHADYMVMFGIQAKDGTPLGDIALFEVRPWHRVGMLGAAIGDPAYWSSGYGTDALLLMVDYAFGWLDMHRVWLGTMSLNARVLRQMEKVGFVPEGRRRGLWYADGAWVDDVLFGLLRDEWPGRAALVEKLGLQAR